MRQNHAHNKSNSDTVRIPEDNRFGYARFESGGACPEPWKGQRRYFILFMCWHEPWLTLACIVTDTWIWAEPANYQPQPRFEHTASRVGHKLVVFGGTLSNDVKETDVHVMDMDTKSWTTPKVAGNKPGPTSGHAAVVWQDQVYVLFGSDGATMTNRVYNYDPSSNG